MFTLYHLDQQNYEGLCTVRNTWESDRKVCLHFDGINLPNLGFILNQLEGICRFSTVVLLEHIYFKLAEDTVIRNMLYGQEEQGMTVVLQQQRGRTWNNMTRCPFSG